MKRIGIYIVSILILLSPFLFFYLQESKAEGKPQISTEETQKELVEFNEHLFKEGGFFSSIGEELSKVGYNYQSFGTIYSMNDIRIHVIVPDNEVITDEKHEEINDIYQDVARKHNLKWSSFKIKVVHSSEIE